MIIILLYDEVQWGNTVFTCFLLIPSQIFQTISTLKSLEVNPSSTVANHTLHVFCWGDEENTDTLKSRGLVDWTLWWRKHSTPELHHGYAIQREGLLHTNKDAGLAKLCRSHLCRRERSSGCVCRKKAMVNIFCQHPHMYWREVLPFPQGWGPGGHWHGRAHVNITQSGLCLLHFPQLFVAWIAGHKTQCLTHARSTLCHWTIAPSKCKMI